MKRHLVIALVALGIFCAVAAPVAYGFWWAVQGYTRRECITPTYVDDGQGFGHAARVYASDGRRFDPGEHVGAFQVGRRWCGTVEYANGARLPTLDVPETHE